MRWWKCKYSKGSQLGAMRPPSATRSPKAGEAKRIKLNSFAANVEKQSGASSKVAGYKQQESLQPLLAFFDLRLTTLLVQLECLAGLEHVLWTSSNVTLLSTL